MSNELTVWNIRNSLLRSWKLAITIVVLCVAAAVGITMLLPEVYVANTRVVIGDSDDGDLVETAVIEAQSDDLARQVMDEVGYDGTVVEFFEDVSVDALSVSVIEFTASAPTAEGAAEIAQAMATAYIADRTASVRSTSGVAITSLENRQSSLESDLLAIEAELEDPNLTPVREQSLSAERDRIQSELSATVGALDALRVESDQTVQSTRIVLNATVPQSPASPSLVLNVFIGGVLGVALAFTIVMVREMYRSRLRERDEIASAVGASVIGSIHRAQTSQWVARTRDNLWPADLRDTAKRILWGNGTGPRQILLAASDAQIEGAAMAVLLSEIATRDGLESDVAVVARNDRLGFLLTQAEIVDDKSGSLVYGTERSSDDGSNWRWCALEGRRDLDPERPGVVIILTTITPNGLPISVLDYLDDDPVTAFFLVRAGATRREHVEVSAASLRDFDIEIGGAVVIDPDRFDTTTGRRSPVERPVPL